MVVAASHNSAVGDGSFHKAALDYLLAENAKQGSMFCLYTAWFRCFLGDDDAACSLFKGGMTCGVCSDSGWAEIYSRNF